MEIIKIDDELLASLHSQAVTSERKRMNFDLRTSSEDNSQRMLNVLVPGTDVPIHRHKKSNESVVCLSGKLVEIFYEEVFPSIDFPKGMDAQDFPSGKRLREVLDPTVGNYGCVVWHRVEVLEPSVIFEAKDGKNGEDDSEKIFV